MTLRIPHKRQADRLSHIRHDFTVARPFWGLLKLPLGDNICNPYISLLVSAFGLFCAIHPQIMFMIGELSIIDLLKLGVKYDVQSKWSISII